VIPRALVSRLLERWDGFWRGEFETGIFPDEWHWREGMSLPDITREICNIWKADRLFAGVISSSGIGALCCGLMPHWSAGARLAQDDIWMKAAGSKAIAFHTDAPYISHQFTPRAHNSVTVWIALDDVRKQTGTLQYVPGSHKWTRRNSTAAGAATATAAADAKERIGSGQQQFHTPNASNTAYGAAARCPLPHLSLPV
jgi:phytanoyl-CoA hydroxylase